MRPRESRFVSSRTDTTRRHKPDYILVVISLLLMVIGLIVIYAISPGLAAHREVSENYYISKQLIAVLMGMTIFIICGFIPFRRWQSLQKPLIVAAVAATAVALITPISPEYPAHRWIRIAGFSLQSVELVKFALIITLAVFFANRLKNGLMNDYQRTFKPLLIWVGIIGFVVAIFQKDLGSTGVIMAMVGAMGFVAGLPLKKVLLFVGIILVGALLAISTQAYRRDRFTAFLSPEKDCQSTGYQACQALIAVGSGGVLGKGLAHGGQAYGYLPEAANDSIFAIYAEKFGFVGVAALLSLLLAFFTRLKNIMERAPDDYSRLVVTGVLAWLSTQTIINIGAMIGLLPLKGITLPFISYGGTSVVFVAAIIGLAFNISRYTTYTVRTENLEGRSYDDPAYRRGDRRAYYAPRGRRS